MTIKDYTDAIDWNNRLKSINEELSKYSNLIGIAIIIMLIILSTMTYHNFKKQNEIIETGGYTDGNIKCVCSQEAWDNYVEQQKNINELEFNNLSFGGE